MTASADRHACCRADPPCGAVDHATGCPSCGAVGRAVPDVTVTAMLAPDTAARVLAVERRFCRTRSCDVLYYGADGRWIDKREARVRVAAKEPEPPTTVCYCFDVTAEELRREIHELGEAPSRERIKREIRAGTCDCERNNPSGACCLGEVNAIVKAAVAARTPQAKTGCHG